MQPSPMAETSRLLFPSLRFCIVSFLCQFPGACEASMPVRSVMLPGDGPVFIGPRRPDDQLSVRGELVDARKVLADKQIARDRSLHVMRQRVRSLHPRRSSRKKPHTHSARTRWIETFADLGYISCTDMWPSRV